MIVKKFFKRLKRRFSNNNALHFIKPESFDDPLKSQKGQVRFLLEVVFNYKLNGLKRNGYFIDLAAADPKLLSNTYFLEKHLGWEGLLIEANPYFTKRLRANRTSKVLEFVVGSKENEEISSLVFHQKRS